MRTKHILLVAISLICCSSIWGQTTKGNSSNNIKIVAEKVQILETNTQAQYSQLLEENQALRKQLQEMDKEIELYREDVRTKVSEMYSHMSLWLGMLTLLIGIITAALGVVAPIFLNYRNDKKQEAKLKELQSQIDAAKHDAESAQQALAEIENLKTDITLIKQAVELSLDMVKEFATKTEVNKLFTEALKEEDPHKAAELYTKIIELDASNALAYNNRGIIKVTRLKDIDGSIADFDKSIQIDADSYATYCNRGNARKRKGDLIGAMDDFNKALELNPNNDKVYNNIADTLINLNQLNKALEIINQAILLEENSVYFITRGEIYIAMKRYTDAIDQFTHAISLNAEIKEAYKYREECYRTLAKSELDTKARNKYIALAEADEKRYEELNKTTTI